MSEQANPQAWSQDHIRVIDFRARAFVNGTRYHEPEKRYVPCAGEWSGPFRDHPWVEASEREGWGRELRSAVIFAVKRRMLTEQPYDNIEALMPDKKWVEAAQRQAAIFEAARAWRQEIIDAAGGVEDAVDRFLTRNNGRSTFRKLATDRGTWNQRQQAEADRIADLRGEAHADSMLPPGDWEREP